MNLTIEEVKQYLEKINDINLDNMIFFPTSIYIPYFLEKKVNVGIQNISFYQNGAHTGQVSTEQIKSLGINYVILGHTEIKSELYDDNIIINKKLIKCLNDSIIPILCIGEEKSLINYLENNLDELLKNIKSLDKIIFAYEPVYAISSNSLEIDKIIYNINLIRNYFKTKYNKEIELLYGGSINLDNALEIYNLDCLDGIMIGNSSIQIENLLKILNRLIRQN